MTETTHQPHPSKRAQAAALEFEALKAQLENSGGPSAPGEPPLEIQVEQPRAPEPQKVETPAQQVKVETPPVAVPAPVETQQQPWNDEEFRKDQENWRKRYADQQPALTRSQQEAAKLRKDMAEKDQTIAAVLARVDQLDKRLSELHTKPQAPELDDDMPIYSPENDPEFAALNPEYAERLAAVARANGEYANKRVKSVEAELAELRRGAVERDRRVEEERQERYMSKWDSRIKSIVPHIDSYMPGGSRADSFVEWLHGRPEEYGRAVANPYGNSPDYIADIIQRFEEQTQTQNPQRQTKQSMADIANPSLMGSAPLATPGYETPTKALTAAEMAEAQGKITTLFKQGKRAEANALAKAFVAQANSILK